MSRALVPLSIVLGMGFDTRTQSVAMLAVDGSLESRPKAWAPDYEIDYVDTYSKLNKFYSLDASARYSGSGGSASASLSIVRSAQLEHHSVVLAVRVRVATGQQFFTTASLNEAARSEVTKGLPGFVEKFGDAYIRSITFGGEIAALLVVTSDSSEKLESLKKKAAGEGFGASGSAETTSLIEELRKNYRVQVKYSQTGGGAGSEEAGVITLSPEELLDRISAFVQEMSKTDALTGAVAPLEMQVWPMTKTQNWPGGDPMHPYPPEVEHIAETLDMLRDKRDLFQSLIDAPPAIAPSTFQAAHTARDYLDATLAGAETELRHIIADKSASASLPLESMAQYRIRNLLKVEPGFHENAGRRMDANSPDKAQLARELVGPESFPDLAVWPKFTVQEVWGYRGEDGGRYAGLHWRCAKNEKHTVETVVWPHFGKQREDDGIFVFASSGGSSYRSGNFCGYTPMHAVALRWAALDQPVLDPLPALPTQKIDPPTVQIEAPEPLQSGQWLLQFTADTGLLETSVCAYSIFVTEKSEGGQRRIPLKPSYWMSEKKGAVKVRHTYRPEPGWKPVAWEVDLGSVYVLPGSTGRDMLQTAATEASSTALKAGAAPA